VTTSPADRDAIIDVLVRYATGIDRKDWPLFRTCFTDDVVADYGQFGQWADLSSLTDYMIGAHERMSQTVHSMSNFVVDVQGDEATAQTYVQAVLVFGDGSGRWNEAVGSYDDRLVRSPDGWRIRRRSFTIARGLSGGPPRAR
jgi:hypothetical protein